MCKWRNITTIPNLKILATVSSQSLFLSWRERVVSVSVDVEAYLLLHVENGIAFWNNAIYLYKFNKFNLRGKFCLKCLFQISLEAFFWRLGEYQNVILCFLLISMCSMRLPISYSEVILSKPVSMLPASLSSPVCFWLFSASFFF